MLMFWLALSKAMPACLRRPLPLGEAPLRCLPLLAQRLRDFCVFCQRVYKTSGHEFSPTSSRANALYVQNVDRFCIVFLSGPCNSGTAKAVITPRGRAPPRALTPRGRLVSARAKHVACMSRLVTQNPVRIREFGPNCASGASAQAAARPEGRSELPNSPQTASAPAAAGLEGHVTPSKVHSKSGSREPPQEQARIVAFLSSHRLKPSVCLGDETLRRQPAPEVAKLRKNRWVANRPSGPYESNGHPLLP